MEHTVYNSDHYKKEAKANKTKDILLIIAYILLDVLVLSLPQIMRWDMSLQGLQVGLLIVAHTAVPLFGYGREFTKTTTYYVGNSKMIDQVFERTMGREGLIAALGLGIAFWFLHMYCYDLTRLRYTILGIHIISMIFLMTFPVVVKVLHYRNSCTILKSAEKENQPYMDEVTEELDSKLDYSLFRFKGLAICVFAVCLIVTVIIGNGIGKKAAVSEEALDVENCILSSSLSEEVKDAVRKGYAPYVEFHHLGQQCTVEVTVIENQAGLPVPMGYEIILGYDKNDGTWHVLNTKKEHVFRCDVSYDGEPSRKQAGFFSGKGKIVNSKGKSDIEVVMKGYDYDGADGTITIRFSDGTIMTSNFTATCETETLRNYNEILHYTATMDTPIGEEKAIFFHYDLYTFKMEVEYMGNTVKLEHFIPEE